MNSMINILERIYPKESANVAASDGDLRVRQKGDKSEKATILWKRCRD